MVFYRLGPRLSAPVGDGFTVRISENARRSVLFFGSPSARTGETQYGGTGFLVVYKEEDHGFGHLVTAKHVAASVSPDSGVVVRVNTKEGGSIELEVDEISWAMHPDPNVDVAVVPCSISQTDFDVAYYNLHDLVKPSEFQFRVQCGDPISIAGLFHLHSGSTRNTPIVHSGNIALLPDPRELIPVRDRNTGEIREMEAYLVEAQTLDGLSGAPVFQREMVALSGFAKHNGSPPMVVTGVQLLGVYLGAWDGEPSSALKEDRNLAPHKRVPVGMGVVAPAERILEIIMNDETLKKGRAEVLGRKKKDRAAVMDSGLSVSTGDATNPNHREEFRRLLNVAAKTRGPKD